MIYPAGLQNFAEVRGSGCLYVDKTAIIHDLIDSGKYFFLSRPPQFGKSLLLSALEEYFSGNRKLFEGLDIDRLEPGEWPCHRVFRLDLGRQAYRSDGALEELLDGYLAEWSDDYGLTDNGGSVFSRLGRVIEAAATSTGRKAVVLVDEFDKPVADAAGDTALEQHNAQMLSDLISALIANDRNIRFVMLSSCGRPFGVEALDKVRDISLEPRFSTICGITGEELCDNFRASVERLAETVRATPAEALALLKDFYGSYCFSGDLVGVYNPAALFKAFESDRIGEFRPLATLSPKITEAIAGSGRPLAEFNRIECDASVLTGAGMCARSPETMLYAAGYLTIKGFDPYLRTYTTGYPNREMSAGLMSRMLPLVTAVSDAAHGRELIVRLARALTDEDLSVFFDTMRLFFNGPGLNGRNIVYCLTTLLGSYIQAEYRPSAKHTDLVAGTKTRVFVIEFDFDSGGAAPEAVVDVGCFALPFSTDGRPVMKVAVSFTPDTGNIAGWATADV